MTWTYDDALGLLERSLGYTRGRLVVVQPQHLRRPTPCAGWDLADLLGHMDDALDAFIEAASGLVTVAPPPTSLTRIDRLQHKACALLGAWIAARPLPVTVVGGPGSAGDASLEARTLLAASALEITLHGWDVGQATGEAADVPERLAVDLTEVAEQLLTGAGRATHFADPRPISAAAPASIRLLAWTGRGTEPPTAIPRVPPARGGLAS